MGIMGDYKPENGSGVSLPDGEYYLKVTACKMITAGTGRSGMNFKYAVRNHPGASMFESIYKNSIFNKVITNRIAGLGMEPDSFVGLSDDGICRKFIGRTGMAQCHKVKNDVTGKTYLSVHYFLTEDSKGSDSDDVLFTSKGQESSPPVIDDDIPF